MLNAIVVQDFFKELSKSGQFSSYGGKCIDIFFEKYWANSSADIIDSAIKVANEFSRLNQYAADFEIGICIELQSDFSYLKGVPKTLQYLEKEVFMLSIPDIIISETKKETKLNPLFEQYLSPLPFKLNGSDKNINCFYREYRMHDEEGFDWEDTYSRELLLMI
ncbi:MAG: hypothetical protein P0Y53_14155 [Candidatus Pseudobacter hemicellulosilyticus]|uniref:Uncharacterized protein n=1 Tax=Candidatus Pseudobacter hemicellulosilyticus TaxID=3121375 RepID=A0AAJ5WN02_9BACT|nr:MAG: hypothetical protein P0Y53_14155 [Pseudobacter sp.]